MPKQEVRQKVEFADALGRQLEAAKVECAAAEAAGRKQHALLATREEALSAATQKQQARAVIAECRITSTMT